MREVVQIRTSLHLAARDPRCLYASWDLSFEEQRACNSRSADHHLVLRARLGDSAGPIVAEVHVHPESQHWFVHVDQAGTGYTGELGYYTHSGQWVALAYSQSVTTPSDQVAAAVFAGPAVEFVRVTPVEVPAPAPEPLRELYQQTASVPTAEANFEATDTLAAPTLEADCMQPQAQPYQAFTHAVIEQISSAPWHEALIPQPARLRMEMAQPVWLTPEQEELLETAIVSILRPESIASLELAEQISRKSAAGLASPEESAEAPSSMVPAVEALGIFSQGGAVGEAPPPGAPSFWFNVNAELVIYGATEPDARVSIGGRTIRLREDGSFSYRFALPDGQFSLPITAVATHGDTRQTRLSFRRDTVHTGEVGTHPQDPALKPPAPENIS